MSETTPRERRHQRTRQDILNMAMRIVREKGADKLSLREVARRIDYSPAGLYEYFANKDALIEAICVEADARLQTKMLAVSRHLDPMTYLEELGVAYVEFARQNPEHYIFLFSNREIEFSVNEYNVEDHRKEFPDDPFLIALNAAEAAIEAGFIDPRGQDAFALTYQFWALVHGMSMLQVQLFKSFPVEFEKADREGIRALIRGMGA